MASENISYIAAFIAGIFTFLSPCLLPLIPSFIAYITGVSFSDLTSAEKRGEVRRKTIIHSLLFISGFSVIFILFGLTATAVGKLLFQYQDIIRIAGGVLIIIFGLYLAGILRLDFLIKERKLNIKVKGATYLGSFLMGVTFAAAWTPCAGPILGSILVLASAEASMAKGAALLGAYSLGIAVPFFITGFMVNSFLAFFNRFKKLIGAINVIAGAFLVIVGILIISGKFLIVGERIAAVFAR